MIQTTQAYNFETVEQRDHALLVLSAYEDGSYQILAQDDLMIQIWFADVEAMAVPFCRSIWQPSPSVGELAGGNTGDE